MARKLDARRRVEPANVRRHGALATARNVGDEGGASFADDEEWAAAIPGEPTRSRVLAAAVLIALLAVCDSATGVAFGLAREDPVERISARTPTRHRRAQKITAVRVGR